jgi:hypothetical protein
VDRNHHRELKTSLAASIIFRQTKFNYLVYLILAAMLSILKLWSHLLRIPSIASKPKSTEFRTEELMERTGGQSGGAVKKICNYNSLALRYCSSSETIKIKLKDASKCRKPSVKSNKR